MNMKQYKIEDMMKLASELAKRTFIRDEVNVEWTYTSLEDPICGRRRFARIVWRKLNELVHRVNRDLETENLSWDSVAVTVQGWHSDKVHVTNVRAWMQMWFGNNLYLLTQKEGKRIDLLPCTSQGKRTSHNCGLKPDSRSVAR